MDIGSQLRKLLEQDGITQKQLAKDLNISTTTLNGYVKNRRQPDANTVIRLASQYNNRFYLWSNNVTGADGIAL